MSESLNTVQHKIELAGDLRSVVRIMKSVAAGNIEKYLRSSEALELYDNSVKLGLAECLRQQHSAHSFVSSLPGATKVVVFGSDQGLVGQYNDVIFDYMFKITSKWTESPDYIVIGERLMSRFNQWGVRPELVLAVPSTIDSIEFLVEQILSLNDIKELYIFYNRIDNKSGYGPVVKQLLPLDEEWVKSIIKIKWSNNVLPEIIGSKKSTLMALLHEYLFVIIFRAAADSLSSENDSRLKSMQRAEKNIDDLLYDLEGSFNRQRQSEIDEELFDVLSGRFE